MKKFLLWLITLFFWRVYVEAQTTYYVATNGTDGASPPWGLSWAQPFATISNAIAKASDNDVILVSNGLYVVSTCINVNKGLIVRSFGSDGNEARETTILSGGYTCGPLYVNHANARVSGFTITEGNGTGGYSSVYGGGVDMNGGVLSNCWIVNNVANNYGGGIYLRNNALLTDSIVSSNAVLSTATAYGGGVLIHDARMERCQILSNSVYNSGGGVACLANAILVDCVVASNVVNNTSSGMGGGIHISGTNVSIYNTLMSNNYGGIYGGGLGAYGSFSNLVLASSTIVVNQARVTGAGVQLRTTAPSSVVITNCSISSNFITSTDGSGSGVCIGYPQVSAYTGMVLIVDSRIIGNDGTINDRYGAGAFIYTHGTTMFQNCFIRGNNAGDDWGLGGGISIGIGSACVIFRNCLIAENVLGANGCGGGLLLNTVQGTNSGPNPLDVRIESCTIVSNYAPRDFGGVGVTNGMQVWNTVIVSNRAGRYHPDVTTNDAAAIANVYYCCSPALTNPANHNITAAPQFKGFAGGDYRLERFSPCVNAGTNQTWMWDAFDLDSRRRIDRIARQVDMGCYEYLCNGAFFAVK